MYKKESSKEHTFKSFSKAVSMKQLPSVVLLCGQEQFLIDWALGKLVETFVNPAASALDYSVFAEDEFTADDIIAAAETLPLMSERKLVCVKADPAEFPELSDYISTLPETTLLCFVCEKPDKRKAVYKKIENLGLIYDFAYLDEGSLASWVIKKLASYGKSASQSDIIHFATDAGYFDKERSYGLYNLENDLKKAASLYEQKQLGYDELSSISSGESETAAFKLLDSAFSGRKGEALQLLHNSIKAEMPSKQMGVILRFHALLCSQLEIMYEARERIEKGEAGSSLANSMGVNAYRIDKAVAASKRLSLARLKAALMGAYRIEEDIKGGKLDGKIAMELFIAKL